MNSKSIEDDVIQILKRSVSDSTFSDIDFKNEMVWVLTTLNPRTPNVNQFWQFEKLTLQTPRRDFKQTLYKSSVSVNPKVI